MAIDVSASPGVPLQQHEVQRRQLRPAVVWAILGAFFVCLQMYVHISWIVSDDFRHIGTGVTPIRDWWVVLARVQEVAWGLGMAAMIYFCAWRPWRRNGRMSFDGLFVLAFYFVWWQDPVANFTTPEFNFNSMWVNMGGWGNHIPGWISPGAENNPEPLIYEIGFYVFVTALGAIVGCKMMTWAMGKWPRLGTFGAFAGLYVCFFIGDVILELFYAFTGAYVYGGNPEHLLIFKGHFYQFPIYEPMLIGFLCTGWTALRWFRNDRGESLAERGVEKLKIGRKSSTGVRFLAIVGFLNVVFLATYNVPIQFFQMHPGEWPKDIQSRSYFMNGVCGDGSDHACPGGDLPIQKRGGVHFTPDGDLRLPDDTVIELPDNPSLPERIPFATTHPPTYFGGYK